MLFLVPTPIGNLGDMTFRAVETLREVDYVLCEDTRHSQKLMHHFEIKTRLVSYHKFNEAEREESVIADLKAGKSIAMVSDGGTPGIADPGQRLVKRCHEEGIGVTSLPGACAITVALTAAGADSERFQFVGFLPKKEGELRRRLAEAGHFEGTTVAYEAPKRIRATLEILGERTVCLARELTKKFEQVRWGKAVELLDGLEERGEMVLLITGESPQWRDMEPKAHVEWIVATFGVRENDAIKLAANLRGEPKREIYREVKT